MSYPNVPEPGQKYLEDDLLSIEEEVEETEPIEDEEPNETKHE